jgi:aspartyl-tRNA(Asn)/glutamyl-tRNA(Gln) amidotransferase subunit C
MIEDVKKIANLANIKIEDNEIEEIQDKFNQVLKYVSKIEEFDLTGVEPMTHVNEDYNVWREDEVKESMPIEDVLLNAPKKNEQFFKVPKVLG